MVLRLALSSGLVVGLKELELPPPRLFLERRSCP